jgi:hypothetical protein
MAQQFSASIGIALAAVALQFVLTLRGAQSPLPPDFHVLFIGFGLFAASSVLSFHGLAPDAGAAMSGHVPRKRPTE